MDRQARTAKRRWRVAAGAAALITPLIALPVIGQQSATPPAIPASESDPAPTSLLPDAFDRGARPAAPATEGDEAPLLATGPVPATEGAAAQVDPFALPVATGRDISVFGPLAPAVGGYGLATFAGSQGAFLISLTRRLAAPVGSRWAAITLRRALLSESAAPAGVVPGDWIAARAWLLVRMGEVDGAKALVDAVPVDRYSPALYRVAAQVALAAADINGLCPIAVTGQALSKDPLWPLAVGMCAAIQGDDITAARIFDELRASSSRVDAFDVRLGERVATLAGGAGRASNIDWSEAPTLTPYRYGVAVAAGVALPADRLASLGPARFGWLVRAPGVAAEIRQAALRPAAVLGTVSAAEMVSAITAFNPGLPEADSPAGRLRSAFAGAGNADRRAALQAIWKSGGDSGDGRYGALIESATAAARLPVSAESADASPDIIAALLAAGMTDRARRWWPVADKAGGAVRGRAWALLATGAAGVAATPSAFRDWRSATGADPRRAALLLAGLAGVGATTGVDWESLRGELLPRAENSWTRAIDAAAAGGRTGEVVILAATGLQGDWRDVPPRHLAHIVAALRRVGRSEEARLIAAEAVTRG